MDLLPPPVRSEQEGASNGRGRPHTSRRRPRRHHRSGRNAGQTMEGYLPMNVKQPRQPESNGQADPSLAGWAEVDPAFIAQKWMEDESEDCKPPETLVEAMAQQARFHHELVHQIVPFWLKGIEAAERGEILKMEDFLNDIIAERKEAGWYWTASDYDREAKHTVHQKEQDRWSNRKASEGDDNGWGPNAKNTWGDDGWGPTTNVTARLAVQR